MRIELNDAQGFLLLDFCKECLADLRMELVLSDGADRQQLLKERRVMLEELRSRLEATLEPVQVGH